MVDSDNSVFRSWLQAILNYSVPLIRLHWLPPGDVTPFVRQHRLVRVSDRHLVVDIDTLSVTAPLDVAHGRK